MNNFRDFSALHTVLRLAYEKVPPDARRASLAELLESWGFTKEQASLYASTVLCQNVESSADWAVTNGSRVLGSWVRGEQQGTEWLNTMKETWKFDINLTYEHKIETYEGYTTPSWTSVQSTYSQPTVNVERGIWAPPDWIRDQLDLFVLPLNGRARSMTLEWIDNHRFNYRACSIDGNRFARG